MSGIWRRRNEALALEVAGGGLIVLLNVLAHRFVPPRAQVPAHLAAAASVVLIAQRAGVSWEAQGLDPRAARRGALVGIATASALTSIVTAGLAFSGTRRLYHDERVVRSTLGQMLYEVLVRIPLATALPEELIFRGSFFGLISRTRSPIVAAGATSVLFGLWHVLPTVDRIPTNPGTRHAHGNPWRSAMVVGGHVAATSLMGLGLAYLRLRSGSIVAPVLAHAAPNAAGFLGGWTVAHATEVRALLARAVGRRRRSPPLQISIEEQFGKPGPMYPPHVETPDQGHDQT